MMKSSHHYDKENSFSYHNDVMDNETIDKDEDDDDDNNDDYNNNRVV